MSNMDQLQISLVPYKEMESNSEYDLDKIIYDLNSQIELLSSQADSLDYSVLKMRDHIPCGKDMFYDTVRKFFWLLNKVRD